MKDRDGPKAGIVKSHGNNYNDVIYEDSREEQIVSHGQT